MNNKSLSIVAIVVISVSILFTIHVLQEKPGNICGTTIIKIELFSQKKVPISNATIYVYATLPDGPSQYLFSFTTNEEGIA